MIRLSTLGMVAKEREMWNPKAEYLRRNTKGVQDGCSRQAGSEDFGEQGGSERLDVGDCSTYRSEIIDEDTPLMDGQSNRVQRFRRAVERLERFWRADGAALVCFWRAVERF